MYKEMLDFMYKWDTIKNLGFYTCHLITFKQTPNVRGPTSGDVEFPSCCYMVSLYFINDLFHMADHGSVQILGVGSLGINHLFQYSIQCLHPRSFTMEDKVFQKSENMYKLQLNKYIFHKLW